MQKERGWVSAAAFLVLFLLFIGVAGAAPAGADLTAANAKVAQALAAAQQGDVPAARTHYEAFRTAWYEIEGGVKAQSRTAYKAVEEEMATVQFALLQNPPDASRVTGALQALSVANQRFANGGFPADGDGSTPSSPGATGGAAIGDLLRLLDEAENRAQSQDAAGAAAAMEQFRNSWLEVEGVVLTQSGQAYSRAERDMVDASAFLQQSPPDLARATATIPEMRDYLAPLAGKNSYTMIDAASIILREGLEALLVVVALLGFLAKGGHSRKSDWVWGGVGLGLLVSGGLAVAVKLLVGTGAFGNNNFLIAGWTGIFAAVMLVWVSYWLHSKSSVAEWNRYIADRSTAALAKGNLLSLALLAFLAVFREGTETVLFYMGMAASISTRDLLAGLGLGIGVLVVLAVAILKVGLKIPMRPFFLVSSVLVFYLGFKFAGMGVHSLQLAGVLPTTPAPFIPRAEFLALYPNWQSTLPQILLVLLAVGSLVTARRKQKAQTQSL